MEKTYQWCSPGLCAGPSSLSLHTPSLGDVVSSQGFSFHCGQLILSFPSDDSQISARVSARLNNISWMTADHLRLNPNKFAENRYRTMLVISGFIFEDIVLTLKRLILILVWDLDFKASAAVSSGTSVNQFSKASVVFRSPV